MYFFKELFQFLFHKNHVLTKKIYTFGAVIITTSFISICLLGVNGYASTTYGHLNQEEQSLVSDEVDLDEVDILTNEEEVLVASSVVIINDDAIVNKYKEYLDARRAEKQVEIMIASKNNTDGLGLSTAGTNAESNKATESDKETESKATAGSNLVSFNAADLGVTATRTPITITATDYDVLLRIVEAEVGSEDVYCRAIVANVVINRMLSDYYPDTIEEVVFQNDGKTYQFSPILDGRYFEMTISDKTRKAVNQALAGYDNSRNAIAFVEPSHTSDKAMNWFNSKLTFVMEYGITYFYTF